MNPIVVDTDVISFLFKNGTRTGPFQRPPAAGACFHT